MSQDLSVIESGVSEMALIESQVERLRAECEGLSIKGVDDRTGFKAVREARITVKNLRCDVERRRKELKAEPLRLCRVIDETAKKITEMISPIECRLALEETRITEEKARIKAEKEAAAAREAAERLKVRLVALFETGEAFDTDAVGAMTDLEFDVFLTSARHASEERKAREAAERERLEKERLEREAAEEKARLAREAAEAAERERIRAEREKLEKERAEHEAQVAALRREQEELENARLMKIAEEHAERERLRVEAARAEAEKRKKALRPDTEKLEAFLEEFTERVNMIGIEDSELRSHVTALAAAFKTDMTILINRINAMGVVK